MENTSAPLTKQVWWPRWHTKKHLFRSSLKNADPSNQEIIRPHNVQPAIQSRGFESRFDRSDYFLRQEHHHKTSYHKKRNKTTESQKTLTSADQIWRRRGRSSPQEREEGSPATCITSRRQGKADLEDAQQRWREKGELLSLRRAPSCNPQIRSIMTNGLPSSLSSFPLNHVIILLLLKSNLAAYF